MSLRAHDLLTNKYLPCSSFEILVSPTVTRLKVSRPCSKIPCICWSLCPAVGYYVGLMQSLFFATQAATVLHWSRLSDIVGRKPVLLIGLFGLSISMYCFGLSKTFWGLVIRFVTLLRLKIRVLTEIKPMSQRGIEWQYWHPKILGIGNHRSDESSSGLRLHANCLGMRSPCFAWTIVYEASFL